MKCVIVFSIVLWYGILSCCGVYAPSIKAHTYGDDMGQHDLKLMAHHAPINVLESKHYVKIMMACVSHEWLTTTISISIGVLV
jgi:hypothetical protein